MKNKQCSANSETDRLEKSDRIFLLFTSLLFLLIPVVLYFTRQLDDNTLTNWRWTFSPQTLKWVMFFTITGIVLSFFVSKSDVIEKRPRLFLFSLSFTALLPLWAEPEVILDVSRYFVYAKSMELYGAGYFFREWGSGMNAWTDLPVVPFFHGLIFKYLGAERVYVQFFNTLLFSLTVLLTYSIGKELWDKEKGFYAGLLLLGIPYLPTQTPLMLVDVPTMFFFTLAVFTFLKAVKNGGAFWLVSSSATMFLALFTKFSTVAMLSVIPVVSIAVINGNFKPVLKRSLIVLAAVSFLTAVFVLAKYSAFSAQLVILRDFQMPGLKRWNESLISTFLFQTHPFVSLTALFAIYAAIMKRDKKFLVAGWFVVLLLFLQTSRIRYLVPLFPLFTLMASYGLNELLENKRVRRFMALAIVSSSLAITLCAFLPFLNTISVVNLQRAGGYLDTLKCETVGVYALPQVSSTGNTKVTIPILDFHTNKQLVSLQDSFGSRDKRVEKSSLRYTWEFELPPFYSGANVMGRSPVVVISSVKITTLPWEIERYANSPEILKQFSVASRTFRYKSFVTIFGKNC